MNDIGDTEEREPKDSPAITVERSETWLLAGSSKSGKTFFLAMAMLSPEFELEVRGQHTGIDNFDFIRDVDQHLEVDKFLQELIETGNPPATVSTDLIEYRFTLAVTPMSTDAVPDPTRLPKAIDDTRIRLLDGPGGAMFPYLPEEEVRDDPDLSKLREHFLNEAHDASAVLLCLPMAEPGTGTSQRERQQLISFLNGVRLGHFPGIKRIAVCLTKYESRFFDNGHKAEELARDPANIRRIWKEFDPNDGFFEKLRDCAKKNVEVMLFPVSAFGFVRGTGFANLLPGRDGKADLPMVLEPRPTMRVGHYQTPLYPRAFSQGEVEKLRGTFNLAAPFVYLATGSTNGLLHAPVEDIDPGKAG